MKLARNSYNLICAELYPESVTVIWFTRIPDKEIHFCTYKTWSRSFHRAWCYKTTCNSNIVTFLQEYRILFQSCLKWNASLWPFKKNKISFSVLQSNPNQRELYLGSGFYGGVLSQLSLKIYQCNLVKLGWLPRVLNSKVHFHSTQFQS